ncbi:hypothetical protein H9Q13_04580 [Pontibacter sp. JH31]|uniref:Uncharacterized protein n=1 Tax=Pontibacter aquaedesilientis TaxID=2766980 RepID=A0ABR7XDR2_9BACT|nr:hypothetical protein [Pontibacter aquaedesilientis]MBD1396430.1 hypothetical protein [Pontibacter aquaedesilientis]
MKLIRTILSLALAWLVVFSSLGMTITQHLCAGEVMSTAFFSHSAACEMEKQRESLPDCHKPAMADDCCQDQTIVLELEDEQQLIPTFKLSVPDMTFIAVFAAVWTSLFELYQPAYTHVPDYAPPSLAQDIPVLVQSFLL